MSIKSTLSRSLFGLSLMLLLPSLSAFAQVSDKEKPEKEVERKQQIELKTYVLVDEIAGAAPGLKLPENRSFILAATADLLWEHDEPRARNLFWDALNTLNLMNSRTSANTLLSSRYASHCCNAWRVAIHNWRWICCEVPVKLLRIFQLNGCATALHCRTTACWSSRSQLKLQPAIRRKLCSSPAKA
jgi:hypothetical protein